ncbi:hypothetical protein HY357_00685 [Candidatus Roizmanbacteria bacterium]|nr:hypothetical protein [Candidatus Roizmanbacteria bacterium]
MPTSELSQVRDILTYAAIITSCVVIPAGLYGLYRLRKILHPQARVTKDTDLERGVEVTEVQVDVPGTIREVGSIVKPLPTHTAPSPPREIPPIG